MKRLIGLLALIALVSGGLSMPAAAQGVGLIAPGHVIGNGSAAIRTPTDTPLFSILDQNFSGIGFLTRTGTGTYSILSGTAAGRILVDQGAGSLPAFVILSGDGIIAANGAFTLAASGVTAGTYGDGTHVAQVTVDAKGRATSASSVLITHGSLDLQIANNLSDLQNVTTARANLGLGTFATQNYATPPAIGSTTANTGAFTSLAATSGTVTGPWYINQGSFTPSVSFPSSTAPFGVNESATGTCTTGNNNCYFNFLNISSDNAVVGSGTSGAWVTGTGFLVNHDFGGSAMTGNRAAGTFVLKQTATTGNTALGADYSALVANTTATANDNGTGVTSTTARGQVESLNVIAHLGPAATDFFALQGSEIDTNAESGSSVYYKTGQQITQLATDATQGAVFDAAETISNQAGAAGWKGYGISFGSPTGVWPFTSAATVIGCWSACGTATSFIDMTNAAFSGYFLKSANWSVDGSGQQIINVSGTTGNALKVESSDGSNGGSITLVNTTAAAPTPTKFLRVDSSGDLQILNSAGSAAIMTLPDSGAPTFKGLTTPGLATVGVGGLLGSEATLAAGQMPALTGDVTTPGSSLATTLATVNSNTGSFGSSTSVPSFTVNGKGLITAANSNAIPSATNAVKGLMEGDGTTITCASGICSAIGTGTVSSGTANYLAYYAATGTTVSGLASANNGVLVTNGSGAPSISSTLPSGLGGSDLALTGAGLSYSLIGQGSSTNVALISNPASTSGRTYAIAGQINVGSSGSAGDRVGVYGAAATGAGASDVWGGNFLAQWDASTPGDQNVQGIEVDVNNMKSAIYTLGKEGINITSGGTYGAQDALLIGSTNGSNQWKVGILVSPGSIASTGAGLLINSIYLGGESAAITQINNANDTVFLQRKTDTSPSGYFLRGVNAASNANLFSIGVNGELNVQGSITTKVRTASSTSDTLSAVTDYFVCADNGSAAATENLPSSPATGLTFLIKDCTGSAATHNITITPASGNIDGAATYVMSTAYGSVAVTYTSSQWSIN